MRIPSIVPRRGSSLRVPVAVKRTRRGFVLVLFAFTLPVLLGLAGLAIDIGTMYVVRNEGQTFCDAASIRAALPLNGTSDRIQDAYNAALATPKSWHFGTKAFPSASVDVRFGSAENGPFDSLATAKSAAEPNSYWFAKVEVQMPVDMLLLPVLMGPKSSTVRASAVAGRSEVTGMPENVMPFAPFTNKDLCPACGSAEDFYGFTKGKEYTIRWPSNTDSAKKDGTGTGGGGKKTPCAGDDYAERIVFYDSVASKRETIVFNSADKIKDVIKTGTGMPRIDVGDRVDRTDGAKTTVGDAFETRWNLDTDTTSSTYAEYASSGTGNGERIIVLPILDKNNHVVGFGTFFLNRSGAEYGALTGNEPLCAEYVGSGLVGGPGSAGNGPIPGKLYELRLYQ